MRQIKTDTINGTEYPFIYEASEIPCLEILLHSNTSKKFDHRRKQSIYYIEALCAFDIETTAIYKRLPDFSISDEVRPYAFMYQWQFAINNYVVFGRTWQEFVDLLSLLEKNLNLSYTNRIVIYVHNLSYEWAFMRQFLDFEEGFFLEERQPLKVLTKGGIEFRCSYKLSNMSLRKFCENESGVIHYKLSGDDFDYNKIRYPNTYLTPEEEGYCYNDVMGLIECIRSRLHNYGHTLANIPLTSTGYVRLDMRNATRKEKGYRAMFKRLALDVNLYKACRLTFRGGNTHANILFSDTILTGVRSRDIASSYPREIMCGRVPMTAFTKMKLSSYQRLRNKDDYCFIAHIYLSNVKYIGSSGIPYIPFDKCQMISVDKIVDNGRILKADYVDMWITDVDLSIIKDDYSFDELKINEMYVAKYGMLPESIRNTCLDYYKKKTTLRDVAGKEYEYQKSKNSLNSTYGCMVMRIDKNIISYDPENENYTSEDKPLEELIYKYNESRSNFLLYFWGVWITANARKSLQEGLDIIGKDVVYCDTDSIKYIGDHEADFEKLNQKRISDAKRCGAYATDPKGKIRYMGVWEYEGEYDKFSTLGAKKYIYEVNGEISSTIAGVSKKAGKAYFKKYGFEGFKIGRTIAESGHLTAYYNDVPIHYETTPDGMKFLTGANVALVDNTYTIGVTNEYLDLLYKAKNGIIDMIYV